MTKYRFKTKEEFVRDELWDEEHNCQVILDNYIIN